MFRADHRGRAYGQLPRLCQWFAGPFAAVILAAVTLTASPRPVSAAGFWTLLRSPGELARGGAYFAHPEGPTALYLNPSALPDLEGLQLNLDIGVITDGRTFHRNPDTIAGTDRTYAPVPNTKSPLPPSPGLFGSYHLGEIGPGKLTLAGGAYGPGKVNVTYGCPGQEPSDLFCDNPQRYSNVDSRSVQVHFALGAGYAVEPLGLRLGATFMLTNQVVDTTLNLFAGVLAEPEDVNWDVQARAVVRDYWIPGGILSASMTPLPGLTLAAVVQLPYNAHTEGTIDPALGDSLEALVEIEGDRLAIDVYMPTIVRLSAAYTAPDDAYEIEAAYVWEQWSRNQEIVFQPQEISASLGFLTIDIPDVTIENRWRDTYSLRLGGHWRAIDELLLLRGGVFYEKSPIPVNRTTAGAFDLDKIGFGLGARVDLPAGTWLDLAGGYAYWFPRTVTDSKSTLVNVLDSNWDGHPIGNGTYTNQQVFIMAGAGVQFGI